MQAVQRFLLVHCALLAVTGVGLVVGVRAQQQPAQPPRFQSSVDVTSLDVTVVDDRGRPVTDLLATDFLVRIDDVLRRVVSAEWVSLSGRDATTPAVLVPAGYSSNENTTGGRLVLIVIDEPNISFGASAGIRAAADRFLDGLQPTDRVAAVSLGVGSSSTPFTADRARVKQAVGRMVGQKRSMTGFNLNVSLTEAVEMDRRNAIVHQRVFERECDGIIPQQLEICMTEVELLAQNILMESRADSRQTISSLTALFRGLQAIRDPKTVVLISDGFMLGDELASLVELGALAQSSRTTVHVLRLDESAFDVSQRRAPTTPFEDRQTKNESLEILAGAARGSVSSVAAGADSVFGRIESQMAGYYLLGVESDPADKDGRPHPIRINVSRRGLMVRARKDLVNRPEDDRPRSPREAMIAGLSSPLQLSALPLRLITFSLRGPEPSRIQLLMHADVGASYSSSRAVSIGWIFSDRDGRIVESQIADARLPPVMNGVPSPLQFTGGASLPPGEYTLRLAVAEGDRVGTVEHQVRAGLVDAKGLELSELVAGGPAETRELLQPTVGHTISFGSVHGYLEAYGPGLEQVQVSYEIAARPDSEPLLKAESSRRLAGAERAIFSHVLPVRQLPPGSYVLRALVSSAGGASSSTDAATPIRTMVRPFEVAPPPVLMTSAVGVDSGGLALTPTDLYLPVADGMLNRAFRREDVADAATLQAFRGRVAPGARTAFDAGVDSLGRGEYSLAETSFKRAIDIDSDSSPALAYLAATFAASGHDQEAAGAWQTALIEGSDRPEIYGWLGDALMRINDLGAARGILQEAVGKWPADPRFARPLALLYAMFGQGREAVRTIDRHIESAPADVEALALGVEWIYHLHLSNAVAYTRAEDLKRARDYANRYIRAKGPQVALVKQWVEFVEKRETIGAGTRGIPP